MQVVTKTANFSITYVNSIPAHDPLAMVENLSEESARYYGNWQVGKI